MFYSKSFISSQNSIQEEIFSFLQIIPSRLTSKLIKLRQQKLQLLTQLSQLKQKNNHLKKLLLKDIKQKQLQIKETYVQQSLLRKTIQKCYILKGQIQSLQRVNKKRNIKIDIEPKEENEQIIQKIISERKCCAELEQQLKQLEENKIVKLFQQRSVLLDMRQQYKKKIQHIEQVYKIKQLKTQNQQLKASLVLNKTNTDNFQKNQSLISIMKEKENQKLLLFQELSQFKQEFDQIKKQNQVLKNQLT